MVGVIRITDYRVSVLDYGWIMQERVNVVKDCQSYFATDLPSRRQDKFILR